MIIVRVIVSIVTYIVANQLVFLALAAILPGDNPAFFASLISVVGGLAAAIIAWTNPFWKGRATLEGTTLAYVTKGALIAGAVGFCGGFFGPMLLAPDANQGPLLGIFITGPLGLLVGGIGGFVYSQTQRSK